MTPLDVRVRALAGDRSLVFVARRDAAATAGFLASITTPEIYVVLLRAGRNFIGHQADLTEHVWPLKLVEGCQWWVDIEVGGAAVCDARSTNQGRLVHPTAPLGAGTLLEAGVWHSLVVGATLVGCYNGFVYGV